VKDADGSINHVKVKILPNYDNTEKKVKGFLHWVSKEHSLPATCHLFQPHFLVEDLKKEMRKAAEAGDQNKDKWLDFVNTESHIVKPNAKIWNLHKDIAIDSRFQFERMGYFVLTE
jgi:glutaminyl-tRNA synthetase